MNYATLYRWEWNEARQEEEYIEDALATNDVKTCTALCEWAKRWGYVGNQHAAHSLAGQKMLYEEATELVAVIESALLQPRLMET